jgi:hypothetical protein
LIQAKARSPRAKCTYFETCAARKVDGHAQIHAEIDRFKAQNLERIERNPKEVAQDKVEFVQGQTMGQTAGSGAEYGSRGRVLQATAARPPQGPIPERSTVGTAVKKPSKF